MIIKFILIANLFYRAIVITISDLSCFKEYDIDYKKIDSYFYNKYKQNIQIKENNKLSKCILNLEINGIIVDYFNSYPFNEFNYYKWILIYIQTQNKDVEILDYKKVDYFSFIIYNDKHILFLKKFIKKYKFQPVIFFKKNNIKNNHISLNFGSKIINISYFYDDIDFYNKIKKFYYDYYKNNINILNYEIKYLFLFNEFKYNFIFFEKEPIIKNNDYLIFYIKIDENIKKIFYYFDFNIGKSYKFKNINSTILKSIKNENDKELTIDLFAQINFNFDIIVVIFDKIDDLIKDYIKYSQIINSNPSNKLKLIVLNNNFLYKDLFCSNEICYFYSNPNIRKNKYKKFIPIIDPYINSKYYENINKNIKSFDDIEIYLENNSSYKLFELINDDKYNYELDKYI